MIWTILAFVCVLATKFFTSVRLRGLKSELEVIQPAIDTLHIEVIESETQMEELKLKVEEKEQQLINPSDVVRVYEEALRQPETDFAAVERMQMMEAETEERTGV